MLRRWWGRSRRTSRGAGHWVPALPDVFARETPAAFRRALKASDERLDACCLGEDAWVVVCYQPHSARVEEGRRMLTWMRGAVVEPAFRRQAALMAEGWMEVASYYGPEPHDGVRRQAVAALHASERTVRAALDAVTVDAVEARKAEASDAYWQDFMATEGRDRVRRAFRKPVSVIQSGRQHARQASVG